MDLLDKINSKLKKIVDKQGVMSFSQLISAYRDAYGQSRRNVCRDLKLGETRLFCLETGRFQNPVFQREIEKLSKYYGIDIKLLGEKAYKQYEGRKGKRKSMKAKR